MKLVLIVIAAIIGITSARKSPFDDPFFTSRRVKTQDTGKYKAEDDGRYRPENEGSIHSDNPYITPQGVSKFIPPATVRLAPVPGEYIRTRSYGPEQRYFRTLRDERTISPTGYRYAFDTENQIEVEEAGQLYDIGTNNEALKVHGFFEYVGDDGKPYRVDYTADENGFVPHGAHLPVAPPIPDYILRSIEYNARHAPPPA